MVAAQIEFPFSGARKVRAVFDADPISSDGGALLLRQVDQPVGASPCTVAPVVAHQSKTLFVAMSSSRRSAFAVRRSNLGGVRGALTRSIRLER